MSAYDEHQRAAQQIVARRAVVTLSDTRTPDTDTSGARIRELLQADGHTVAEYQVIPDDAGRLNALAATLLSNPNLDAILTNGGTGVGRRDMTVATLERLIEQPLPGFGELFR